MQKMSQTEEMAKMLAGRARRHVLTPEQVSRAMEEQDFDPAGLDELYAALEMRGVQVAEEETELPLLDEEQIGKLEHELSAEGVALDDPVKTYLKEIGRVPLLSAEEEAALARAAQAGDEDARRRLSEANLRLVVSVAKRYAGRGLPFLDLIQEGNIGLMKAVRHYDPDKGVRLMTFAVHWIRAEIQEYIVRNSHMVKLATTHAQRKLFFNLRQMKKTDQALTNAQAEDIAEKLNVKPKEVLEMEKRLSGPDASLDTPLDEEGDSSVTAVDMLSDKSDEPVEILEKADELQLEQVGLKKAIEQWSIS